MKEMGFYCEGKNFFHNNTKFSVEFPSGPIGIGDRVPIILKGKIKVRDVTVVLLSPTQSVMDRLAWFYFNNDRQCLDQAIMITKKQPVKLNEVKNWSVEEKMENKFDIFLEALKNKK